MDAQDLLNRVKRKIGLLARRQRDPELTPTDADDEALLAAVQDGLIEIAKKTGRFHAHQRIELEPSRAVYGLSEAMDVLLELRTAGGRSLTQKPGADVRAKALAEDAAQGRPRHYGLHSGVLWLNPVPAQAETLTAVYQLNGAIAAGRAGGGEGGGALLDERATLDEYALLDEDEDVILLQ